MVPGNWGRSRTFYSRFQKSETFGRPFQPASNWQYWGVWNTVNMVRAVGTSMGKHQKAKVARRERAQEALKQIRESGIPELVDRVQGDFRRVDSHLHFCLVRMCAAIRNCFLQSSASMDYYSVVCHICVRSFTAKPTSGPCAGSTKHVHQRLCFTQWIFYVQNVKVQIGDHKASLFPYIHIYEFVFLSSIAICCTYPSWYHGYMHVWWNLAGGRQGGLHIDVEQIWHSEACVTWCVNYLQGMSK